MSTGRSAASDVIDVFPELLAVQLLPGIVALKNRDRELSGSVDDLRKFTMNRMHGGEPPVQIDIRRTPTVANCLRLCVATSQLLAKNLFVHLLHDIFGFRGRQVDVPAHHARLPTAMAFNCCSLAPCRASIVAAVCRRS